jgi:hypothetical protein
MHHGGPQHGEQILLSIVVADQLIENGHIQTLGIEELSLASCD